MSGEGKRITIAIDGPAASGKSTTARAVAERLGYCHLNSGQLYRAITWAAIREGWVDDVSSYARRVAELDLQLERDPPGFVVRVDGMDPAGGLTEPTTSARVAEVSARPEVRKRVLELLREAGKTGGIVCDGRDIGTVVFPHAELKVFLVASAWERGRRRLLEEGRALTPEAIEEETQRLVARDRADSSRELSPLKKPPDAVEIDTTDLRPEEVVERIVEAARLRAGGRDTGLRTGDSDRRPES